MCLKCTFLHVRVLDLTGLPSNHQCLCIVFRQLSRYLFIYNSLSTYLRAGGSVAKHQAASSVSCLCLGTAATPRCGWGGGRVKGWGGERGGGTAADLNMEQSSLWCYNKELRTCKFLFDISSSSLYLKKRSKILYILVVDNCNGPLSSSDAFSQQKEISINKQSCLDDWRLLCWPGGGRGRGRGGAAAV